MALHDATGRPRIRTTVGVPVGTRPRLSPEAKEAVRRQLERGVFLASFDAVSTVRDISSDPNRVNLVVFRDERLLTRFDDLQARRPR
jgi:hypothetical protein